MPAVGTQEPTVQRQIEVQLDSLGSEVERLKTLVSKIGMRLTPVMRDENPGKDEDKAVTGIVPLAHEMRLIATAIQEQNQIIEDYINRMEI